MLVALRVICGAHYGSDMTQEGHALPADEGPAQPAEGAPRARCSAQPAVPRRPTRSVLPALRHATAGGEAPQRTGSPPAVPHVDSSVPTTNPFPTAGLRPTGARHHSAAAICRLAMPLPTEPLVLRAPPPPTAHLRYRSPTSLRPLRLQHLSASALLRGRTSHRYRAFL